jgi:peroxiredoxin
MALAVGQQAPDFELNDQTDNPVRLSEYAGEKAVALVFYPFTFSGLCQDELCTIRDDFSQFESAGVQVIALSCDSKFSQKTWAESMGYGFPVLSDFWPHGAAAQAYGVFNETTGSATRATFLIGADGVIVDAFETDGLGTIREHSLYGQAIAKL